MEKITIVDVAKAAGVSVATVSYVLNGRKDQKISEETVKKVWQWANLLNYKPSQAAVALRSNVMKKIAVVSKSHLSFLEKIEIMDFIEGFSDFVKDKGYKVALHYLDEFETIDGVDAIITFMMPRDSFYALSKVNVVPVIAYSTLVNDSIFYQVNVDYQAINFVAKQHFKHETFAYLALHPHDDQINQEIDAAFKNKQYFAKIEELEEYMNNLKVDVVTISPTIYQLFTYKHPETRILFIEHIITQRYQKLFECFNNAFLRVSDVEHFIRI